MKVLVTGATGYIGSRVVDLLLAQGHQVVGLCRGEEGAKALRAKGVEPLIGDIRVVEPLAKAASEVDAVLHLAFIHDFAKYDECVAYDKNLINAFHQALKGTNKPLIVTSGTLAFGATKPGHPLDDSIDAETLALLTSISRGQLDIYCLGLAKEGSNIRVIRLPSFVYGHNASGFVVMGIQLANRSGYAPYIGEGNAHVAAVHVDDAASAYVCVLNKGKAGQGYHAVSEINTTFKELAEAIGNLVGVPAKSVSMEEAIAFYGNPFLAWIHSTNHQATYSRLAECGWKPNDKISMVQDIVNGSYRKDAKYLFTF